MAIRSSGVRTMPGTYCMKLFPEKNYGKVNGKFMLARVFRFYQSFFSGKSFMQWAPGRPVGLSTWDQNYIQIGIVPPKCSGPSFCSSPPLALYVIL